MGARSIPVKSHESFALKTLILDKLSLLGEYCPQKFKNVYRGLSSTFRYGIEIATLEMNGMSETIK